MAVALVALGVWGFLNPGGYVYVGRVLDHVGVFGAAALLVAGLSIAAALTVRSDRVVVAGLSVVVALAFAGAWWVVVVILGDGDQTEVAHAVAPGATYTAVVRLSYADVPDPSWVLSVRQTQGVLSREWLAGKICGDHPDYNFQAIRWVDQTHLELQTTAGRNLRVTVNRNGQPSATLGGRAGCAPGHR